MVVKPNWVMHRNGGMWGTECLITQPSLIREVVELLLASGVGRVEVGDAPVQGCEFSEVVRGGDLAAWAKELAARDGRFAGLHDYRRTRSRLTGGVLVQAEDQISLSDFVLFDLGPDSLLEPVSSPKGGFRVTQYDPRKMAATHGPGRHQYLVARAVLEADVVLNLPKLKTHRKAGLTNALKNLVGVNGNKEFLPHHRVGGSAAGGDCYPGSSLVKVLHERLLDAQNLARSHAIRRALGIPVRLLSAAGRALVDTLGVEGAWSGNDTVWRMCLDLNRIVLYGRPDGTMADRVQRRILTISDAIVAGQGDGPLMPEPFPLGVLLAGDNPAAVDLV
ncbi:MAG TPA: DUF362 domain-containing protein, partial [Gemmatimonadales bacterium]|nr:DUF362 domain-containing protein [Gemmatimonadales bacterium]